MKPVNVLVIGGGTGGSIVLRALKAQFPGDAIRLTGLTPGSDSGGSSGDLRQQFGCPAFGDARRHIAALSPNGEWLNQRFASSDPRAGHTAGNLALLESFQQTGCPDEAIRRVGNDAGMEGSVHLVTLDTVDLCYRTADGRLIVGEHLIVEARFRSGEQPDLFLTPTPAINPAAAAAIAAADVIIIGPGNLYGSLFPVLIVPGVAEALATAAATKVYICNLVTASGQTDGFQVHDFVDRISQYVAPDVVIYNNGLMSEQMLGQYAQEGQRWVGYDSNQLAAASYTAIGAPLICETPIERVASDPLANRNVLRHDTTALGAIFQRLID